MRISPEEFIDEIEKDGNDVHEFIENNNDLFSELLEAGSVTLRNYTYVLTIEDNTR